jgi:hypothetical protein
MPRPQIAPVRSLTPHHERTRPVAPSARAPVLAPVGALAVPLDPVRLLRQTQQAWRGALPVQTAVIQRLQQTRGNRAARRITQQTRRQAGPFTGQRCGAAGCPCVDGEPETGATTPLAIQPVRHAGPAARPAILVQRVVTFSLTDRSKTPNDLFQMPIAPDRSARVGRSATGPRAAPAPPGS